MVTTPPTHPSPMDLVEIIRVFGLLPEEERRSSMFGHFELMPPDHPFPLVRPIAVDLWLPKIFADAAHIYWIANDQAQCSQHADTWASAKQSDREIAALEYLWAQWQKATAVGKLLNEVQAVDRASVAMDLNTPDGLFAALNECGYPHIPGRQISECVLLALSRVRDVVGKRTEAAKKQRQRKGETSRGADKVRHRRQSDANPWSLALPFLPNSRMHRRIVALAYVVRTSVDAAAHEIRTTGRDNSQKSHRD